MLNLNIITNLQKCMKIVDAQLNRMLLDLLRSQQQLFDNTILHLPVPKIYICCTHLHVFMRSKKYTVAINVSLFLLA